MYRALTSVLLSRTKVHSKLALRDNDYWLLYAQKRQDYFWPCRIFAPILKTSFAYSDLIGIYTDLFIRPLIRSKYLQFITASSIPFLAPCPRGSWAGRSERQLLWAAKSS